MKALILTLVLSAAGWAQYRIAGIAVDSAGLPLRKVRLELRLKGQSFSREAPTVITGQDGKFLFPDLKPGGYSLTAFRRGLPPMEFGAVHFGSTIGSLVMVGPGQDTENLVYRMETPAAMEGTVTSSLNEPVASALVTLWKSAVNQGRRSVRPYRYAYTDDRGYYRFGHLTAGTYYLSATGEPWYSQQGSAMDSEAFLPVFFPNTTRGEAAAPIPLQAGQEGRADLTMTPAPGGSVTVTVKGDAQNLLVNLVQPGMRGGMQILRTERVNGGKRELAGVAPGRYVIRLHSEREVSRVFALATVDVLPGANTKVELTPGPGASVTGKVECDSKAISTRALLVVLMGESDMGGQSQRLKPDGTFAASGLVPGKYSLSVMGARHVGLEDLKVEGATLLPDQRIAIPESGAVGISVRLTGGDGRIRGKVVDGFAKPVASRLVVAAKRGKGETLDTFWSFATETDGSFDFEDLEPGDYALFAIEDPDEVEYREPAVYRELLKSALRATAVSGKTVEQDLKLR